MKRHVPKMTTDEEAEAFLESDLSDLDFAEFKPAQFAVAGAKPSRLAQEPPTHLAPGTPAPYSGIYRRRDREAHGPRNR
jgi:hypothetical protein